MGGLLQNFPIKNFNFFWVEELRLLLNLMSVQIFLTTALLSFTKLVKV